jgi:hypothetical protein
VCPGTLPLIVCARSGANIRVQVLADQSSRLDTPVWVVKYDMGAVALQSRVGVNRLTVSIWRQLFESTPAETSQGPKPPGCDRNGSPILGCLAQAGPALPGREFVGMKSVQRQHRLRPPSMWRMWSASSRPSAGSRGLRPSRLWVHAVPAHRMLQVLIEGCGLAQRVSLSELASERIWS